MKFIHCADIHLDSPLRGLSRYQDAPVDVLRGATRRAFENLVALAVQEQVAFVVMAGDLYDGTWQDFNTGLFFVAQMARLDRHGIPVYLVKGNHDADSRITRALPLPSNVTVFDARRPHTVVLEAWRVALHGQSFADAAVRDDLAAHYPARVPGMFNVGLLHTSVNGREGHADYAPTSLDTLVSRGYDYWALGHVHAREILHRDPWVVFPGNLQGRHIRETGSKGCELVTVEDGHVQAVEHRAVDVLRWSAVDVDVTGLDSTPAVMAAVQRSLRDAVARAEGRPVAARVRLSGRCQAHGDLLSRPEQVREDVRALAMACEGDLWLEKVLFQTRPPLDRVGDGGRDDAVGNLMGLIERLRTDAALQDSLAASWQELVRKLPPELAEGDDRPWADGNGLRGLLDEVEATLLPRLLEACKP